MKLRYLALLLLPVLVAVCGAGFGPQIVKGPIPGFSSPTAAIYEHVRYDVNALGLNDGDAVTFLTDQGVYKYHALQGTAGARPYWTNNAGEINNQGYLKFSGSQTLSTNWSTLFPPPYHVFMVAALPSSGSYSVAFGQTAGSNWGRGLSLDANNARATCGAFVSQTCNLTDWAIWEICFNGLNSYIRTNGPLLAAGYIGTNNAFGVIFGDSSTMKLAYWSMYTNALTDALATEVTATLATRYGITTGTRDALPPYRLGDWATNISTGAELAVYDFSTMKASNGDALTRAPDSGPLGYDLRATNAPMWYSADATNQGLGHVAMNVFGMTQQMLGTNWSATYPQPTTLIMVGRSQHGGTANFVTDTCNAPGDAGSIQQTVYLSTPNMAIAAPTEIYSNDDVSALWIYEWYFDGANSYYKTNNVTRTTGNPGTHGRKGITFGGSRSWNLGGTTPLEIYWAGLYTNTLGAAARSNLYWTLGKRFNIAVTVP